MIPTGLRAYPNWRRRRLKGETDSEMVAPIRKRQLDPVERLDREGVHLKASERHASNKKVKAERTRDAGLVVEEEDERIIAKIKKGDEERNGEGDDAKERDEEDDGEKLTAVDRAIARYMHGGKPAATATSQSHQDRNWDIL
jgi:hypothetical protein